MFKARRHFILWPLIAGAFSLQLFAPLTTLDFYLVLLADDLADVFLSAALFVAIPYHSIGVKIFSLGYWIWCLFAFLSNLAIEVDMANIRQWQQVCAAICLCVGGFLAGWVHEMHKMEKDY